jgi:hypothetical protein
MGYSEIGPLSPKGVIRGWWVYAGPKWEDSSPDIPERKSSGGRGRDGHFMRQAWGRRFLALLQRG